MARKKANLTIGFQQQFTYITDHNLQESSKEIKQNKNKYAYGFFLSRHW